MWRRCLPAVEVIISSAADQKIVAARAIQQIAAAVSGKDVVACVAIGAVGSGPEQGRILDGAVAERKEIERCRIRSHFVAGVSTALFVDGVKEIDEVDVIAAAAAQSIRPRTAIQNVLASVACQDIGRGVAHDVEIGRTQKRAVLDLSRSEGGEIDGEGARLQFIAAVVALLIDDVSHAVHHVDIVARTAVQGIVAGAAIKRIVPASTIDLIVCAVAGQLVGKRGARDAKPGASKQRGVFDGAAIDCSQTDAEGVRWNLSPVSLLLCSSTTSERAPTT